MPERESLPSLTAAPAVASSLCEAPAVRKHHALIACSVQVGIDEPTILGCEGDVLYFYSSFLIRRRSR